MRTKPSPDFSVLNAEIDKGIADKNQKDYASEFDKVVREQIERLQLGSDDDATQHYHKMCTAINAAVEVVLPAKRRRTRAQRKVSKETKKLYVQRSNMTGKHPADYEALQKDIQAAGLTDFKKWVQECANELSAANGVGDTKELYNIVRRMEGKPEKPPRNLTKNKDGVPLSDASEVAATWHSFLKEKFRATHEEIHVRPPMPELPQAAQDDILTEKEILSGLNKMKRGKACGLDNIPAEVYQNVPVCNG